MRPYSPLGITPHSWAGVSSAILSAAEPLGLSFLQHPRAAERTSGHSHSEADSIGSSEARTDKPGPGRLPIRSSSERTHSGGSGLTCSIPCRLRTAIPATSCTSGADGLDRSAFSPGGPRPVNLGTIPRTTAFAPAGRRCARWPETTPTRGPRRPGTAPSGRGRHSAARPSRARRPAGSERAGPACRARRADT